MALDMCVEISHIQLPLYHFHLCIHVVLDHRPMLSSFLCLHCSEVGGVLGDFIMSDVNMYLSCLVMVTTSNLLTLYM